MVQNTKYGNTDIDYTVQYSNRKTLSIEVYPNLEVNVIAPMDASSKEIEQKVLKRAAWIVKQKSYFESFLPRIPQREYVAGETHLYLGRRYVLKLRNEKDESVKLKAGNIIVSSSDLSPHKVKLLLGAWYYRHAEIRFQIIMNDSFERFNSKKLTFPKYELKRMKNRWGSCTTAGKIIINPEIIKAPSKCIEYVITHEICHLVHPNHSKEFFGLLDEKMPDWNRWKMKLELLLA
jgi:predicted metal-dependent hydrolase